MGIVSFLKKNWLFALFVLIIVGFLIGNGLVFFFAFSSWKSGKMEEGNRFSQGKNYSIMMKQFEAQKKLGWKGNLFFKRGFIYLILKDKNGKHINDKYVLLRMMHSIDQSKDRDLVMQPNGNSNIDDSYFVHWDKSGMWNAYAYVKDGDKGKTLFELRKSFNLNHEEEPS